MGHGGRFLGDLKLRQDEVLFGRCGVVKQFLFFFHHHHHTVHCSPPVKLYRDFPASASNTPALTLLVVRCRLKSAEDGKTCRSPLIPLCACMSNPLSSFRPNYRQLHTVRQYTPYNTYLIGGCSTRICGLRCVILLQSSIIPLSPSLLYFLQPPLSSHPPATPVFTLTSPLIVSFISLPLFSPPALPFVSLRHLLHLVYQPEANYLATWQTHCIP